MPSILQAWVEGLPIRAQGTLLVAMRSCDVSEKRPTCEGHGCSTGEGTPDRALVAYLRFLVMNPADVREVDMPGSFMRTTPPENWKPSQFGHFPLHWYCHVMHAFEVAGFHHPTSRHQTMAWDIYVRMANNLHLIAESREQFDFRINEDRIANGTVAT